MESINYFCFPKYTIDYTIGEVDNNSISWLTAGPTLVSYYNLKPSEKWEPANELYLGWDLSRSLHSHLRMRVRRLMGRYPTYSYLFFCRGRKPFNPDSNLISHKNKLYVDVRIMIFLEEYFPVVRRKSILGFKGADIISS